MRKATLLVLSLLSGVVGALFVPMAAAGTGAYVDVDAEECVDALFDWQSWCEARAGFVDPHSHDHYVEVKQYGATMRCIAGVCTPWIPDCFQVTVDTGGSYAQESKCARPPIAQ